MIRERFDLTEHSMGIFEKIQKKICDANGEYKPNVKLLLDVVKQDNSDVSKWNDAEIDKFFECLIVAARN